MHIVDGIINQHIPRFCYLTLTLVALFFSSYMYFILSIFLHFPPLPFLQFTLNSLLPCSPCPFHYFLPLLFPNLSLSTSSLLFPSLSSSSCLKSIFTSFFLLSTASLHVLLLSSHSRSMVNHSNLLETTTSLVQLGNPSEVT